MKETCSLRLHLFSQILSCELYSKKKGLKVKFNLASLFNHN